MLNPSFVILKWLLALKLGLQIRYFVENMKIPHLLFTTDKKVFLLTN